MFANPQPPPIHLPKGWQDCIKSAVLHAIALAHYAIVYARVCASDSIHARVRLAAENDHILSENPIDLESLTFPGRYRSMVSMLSLLLDVLNISRCSFKSHHQLELENLALRQQLAMLKKRSDLLLSTLRNCVESMGGNLRLVAELPDQPSVILTGFADIEGDRPKR